MKNDLISIIVPIYKVEQYLPASIDSMLKQTYENIEIILVDDGSPDNCPKICDEYAKKDNRIKVIHQKNSGICGARNSGLDVCNGQYISFVDSDDTINSKFIETLYNICIDNDADIAQCDYVKILEKEKLDIIDNDINNEISDDIEIYDYKDYFKFFNVRGNPVAVLVWNKLYKRHLFDNFRNPEGKVHEDEATTYIVCKNANKIAVTQKKLYNYNYTNTGSFVHNYNSKRLSLYEFLDARLKVAKELSEKDYFETLTYILYRIRMDYMNADMSNLDNTEKELILKKLDEHFKHYYSLVKSLKEYTMTFKDKVMNYLYYNAKTIFVSYSRFRLK